MSIVSPIVFGLALAAFSFAMIRYVRTRLALSKTYNSGEPLAVDGWLTFPNEPEYEGLYIDLRNEAFGNLCRVSLIGVLWLALALGHDVKHDIFAFLMDLK